MFLDGCYISYINLNHRTDRLVHMQKELSRISITAERFEAIKFEYRTWDANKVSVMYHRSKGAIGCWASQVAVMEISLSKGRHAFVMEDDLVFCSDFKERIDYIEIFLEGKPWDCVFLGGTIHADKSWWHIGGKNPDLPNTKLTRDAECTDDPRILRTYAAFSTHAYIVNKDSISKVLSLLDSVQYEAMGIDWAFIRLGDLLTNYMFVPGCIKQFDNRSDIGQGMTIFSGFAKLGPYWWQDKMTDFDPTTFDWGDAKR